MAVLGILSEGQNSLQGVIVAVRRLQVAGWCPTGDTIAWAVKHGLDAGLLRNLEQVCELEITASGRRRFQSLLTVRVDGSGAQNGRIGSMLRLRFLHLLGPSERALVLADLAAFHDEAIVRLKSEIGELQHQRKLDQAWLRHEIDWHKWEANWIDSLTQSPCGGASPLRDLSLDQGAMA